MAKGLLALDIKPGEHVGIWATNLPEWTLLQFGAASIGVVLVTINPAYRPVRTASYRWSRATSSRCFLPTNSNPRTTTPFLEKPARRWRKRTMEDRRAPRSQNCAPSIAIKPNAPEGYLAWKSMIEAGRKIKDGAGGGYRRRR